MINVRQQVLAVAPGEFRQVLVESLPGEASSDTSLVIRLAK